MADAVELDLGKNLLLACGVHVLHAIPAIGGDDFQRFRRYLQQMWNEGAAPFFEVTEHPHLVLEALFGLMPAKGFVDAAVVADAHERAGGVFHFAHDTGYRDGSGGCERWQACPAGRQKGKRG